MLPLAPTGWMLARTDTGRRAASAIAKHFLATLHGHENLPQHGQQKGALIVGNHAFLGIDAIALSAVLLAETNTLPRFLGEKNLFRIPGLNAILKSVGAIPGTPDDAVALLEAGEIVGVYPGGIDDSFKVSAEAYKLQWKDRAGFVRVAMRAGAPIIPIAATGVDELYEIPKRESFVGRLLWGSSRYDIPLPGALLPKRVPLDFYVLPSVDTRGDPKNPDDVERVRLATEKALRSVLDPYRESRGLSSTP